MNLYLIYIFVISFYTKINAIYINSGNNVNIVAYTFDTQLDDQDQYHLYWNYDTNSVTFRVKAQLAHNNDWFAIGFSHDGGIGGADMCIMWADAESNLKLQELHVDSEGLAVVDPTNDCLHLNASLESNQLSFGFRRAFNTCDPFDYIIEDGTTNMVYATGSAPKNHTIDMNDSKHGSRPIRLMDIPDRYDPDLENAKIYDFLKVNITVPESDNSWLCSVHLLPDEFQSKHHIIKYEPVIQPGHIELVHHMKLTVLKDPVLLTGIKYVPVVCGTRSLNYNEQIVAWANGSKPFVYPEEVGVAVGGQSGPQYLLLETHYHNLAYKPDILDSSGLRIYVINKPRKYDAGLVKIGMNSFGKYVDLPPNRPVVDLSVYVTPECSSVALPVNGITIFAQEFHTHQKRTRVWTQHVRNGTELAEFNRDNHCNYQFLDIWLLKQRVTVMPGDVLVHTCSYDTTKNPVAPDIMCSTFFHYYPATNLKWVVNELGPYIRYLGQHLDYTEQQLNDNRPPFEEICDKLSGESYPGNWSAIPVPKILVPLQRERKVCGLNVTINSGYTKQSAGSGIVGYIREYRVRNPIEPVLVVMFGSVLVFVFWYTLKQCLTAGADSKPRRAYAYRKLHQKSDIKSAKLAKYSLTDDKEIA